MGIEPQTPLHYSGKRSSHYPQSVVLHKARGSQPYRGAVPHLSQEKNHSKWQVHQGILASVRHWNHNWSPHQETQGFTDPYLSQGQIPLLPWRTNQKGMRPTNRHPRKVGQWPQQHYCTSLHTLGLLLQIVHFQLRFLRANWFEYCKAQDSDWRLLDWSNVAMESWNELRGMRQSWVGDRLS